MKNFEVILLLNRMLDNTRIMIRENNVYSIKRALAIDKSIH